MNYILAQGKENCVVVGIKFRTFATTTKKELYFWDDENVFHVVKGGGGIEIEEDKRETETHNLANAGISGVLMSRIENG